MTEEEKTMEEIEAEARAINDAIVKLAERADAMLDAGLNRRALVTLLHDSTNVPRRQIDLVLDGLLTLAEDHTA